MDTDVREPTGEQVDLRAHGYTATVTQLGATLRLLAYEDRPLVRGFAADQPRPVYSGALLAPWPNRIGDGRYHYDGAEHLLPINEQERATALHGLVAGMRWDIASSSPDAVALRHTLRPGPGYPFQLDLDVAYRLTAYGLEARLTARNAGNRVAPYGCGIHPYLVAGEGQVDDWTLQLPAARYLDVDPERLLPIGERTVDGTPFDFREPRPIGDVDIDNAFGGIGFDSSGHAAAVLVDRQGSGVRITWNESCPWVQVHTADRPEPELHRTGLAVEPMTCPPDAFRTGTDVVHLRPGQTHTVTWRLTAI
ncbi:MAG: galactose mutarotase [Actinophytocola sp.]|nr:galactose mutarotase [Actinophytocola sp.]